MLTDTYSRALSVGLILVVLAGAGGAMAADSAVAASAAQNWRDFIHFIRIARPDAALSYGKALLGADVDARDLYRLSVETDGAYKTLAQGANLEGLGETVEAVRALIEEGYRLESRDPELIDQAIKLLSGHIRQYATGSDRLKASGEYAVPQLVRRLADPATTPLLRDRIATVLPQMGKDVVRPLSEALVVGEPTAREIIAQSLGQIGYWHAAPYLRAMLDNPDELDRVKNAARASLIAVTGRRDAAQTPVAGYFYQLGRKYYAGEDSVQPDARFAKANIWYWQDGLGLDYKEAPRSIFLDIYAMRSARQTLISDQSFSPAVALWLQANLRKEANLPAGEIDPTRGDEQMGAYAYAKAAGAKYMQEVLANALVATETEVVKGAIAALADTAGASNLVTGDVTGSPLVAAMTYPALRVRLMAGEAMASALPTDPFTGSELVIPTLVEAIRQTGRKTVLLIEPEINTLNKHKDMIRRAGFEVVDASNLAAAMGTIEAATGIDLIVLSTEVTAPGVEEALAMIRQTPRLTLLPVMLTAADGNMVVAKRVVRNQPMVNIVEAADLDLDGMAAGLAVAVAAGVGAEPMSAEEATDWALRASASLRDLGRTRTTVFNLLRAEKALIDALADKRDALKVAAARALAVVPSGTAQQAIVALAGSSVGQSVRIAAYQAAAENVRQIGRQLTDQQAEAVVNVVKADASQAIRDAASELLGALNLPSEQIKLLIVDSNE